MSVHRPIGKASEWRVPRRGMPFEELINKNGPVVKPELGPCWLWMGSLGRNNYGRFWLNGRHVLAHKHSFLLTGRVIPEGYELDHLCRVHECVNPDHLEAVTHWENMRRSIVPQRTREFRALIKHCKRGHEFTPENTFRKSNGGRGCRICKNDKNRLFMREFYRKKRANQNVSS